MSTSKPLLTVRGVDFVMYPVSNLAGAAAFYRETLGLKQTMYSDEWQWAEFDCGNVTLALKSGERVGQNAASPRIALAVANVRDAYAQFKENGYKTNGQPMDYGVCCALEVLDPDGNVVILHQRADGTCG